jgi:hypothetical protein
MTEVMSVSQSDKVTKKVSNSTIIKIIEHDRKIDTNLLYDKYVSTYEAPCRRRSYECTIRVSPVVPRRQI